MTTAFPTTLAALSLFLLAVPPVSAQTPATRADQCADTADAAAYARCALWVDGRSVRRGLGGDVVARPGFFRPARLTRLVAGDSARVQAARYEVNSARATLLSTASGLLVLASLLVADSYNCAPWEFQYCRNVDDSQALTASALIIGGVVTGLASVPFAIRATRAMGRAIWWHNARFAR